MKRNQKLELYLIIESFPSLTAWKTFYNSIVSSKAKI